MKNFLILDTNYLCYRSFHTMGHLSYGDVMTGVTYGVLQDVFNLQAKFECDQVLFCFDHGKPLRCQTFPAYKQKRHERAEQDEEAQQTRIELLTQIEKLKKEYLKEIGYRNILYRDGFEADDIIASLVKYTLDPEDSCVIVSADTDLYQLLREGVVMYNPTKKKVMSSRIFIQEMGLERPSQWVHVKALAGCVTDEIPGIAGVGEATALRYLKGELKASTKAYQAITSQAGQETYRRNRALVDLPIKGRAAPGFVITSDQLSEESWKKVAQKLGFKSMISRPVKSIRHAQQLQFQGGFGL